MMMMMLLVEQFCLDYGANIGQNLRVANELSVNYCSYRVEKCRSFGEWGGLMGAGPSGHRSCPFSAGLGTLLAMGGESSLYRLVPFSRRLWVISRPVGSLRLMGRECSRDHSDGSRDRL